MLWNTAQHEYSTYGDVNLKDRVKALATLGRTPYGGRARVSAKAPTGAGMVEDDGIEPTTPCLQSRCSPS